MKWFKVLVALALLMLAVSLAPSAVRADEPDYSNPVVMRGLLNQLSTSNPGASDAYTRLTPKARQAVIAVIKRSKLYFDSQSAEATAVDDEDGTETAQAWCPGASSLHKSQNRASFADPVTGFVQFRMTQVLKYCYNGAWITKVPIPLNRRVQIFLIGWQFDGYFGDWNAGGVGQWEYDDFFQGKFNWCIGGCIMQQTPWLYAELYANGFPLRDGGF